MIIQPFFYNTNFIGNFLDTFKKKLIYLILKKILYLFGSGLVLDTAS